MDKKRGMLNVAVAVAFKVVVVVGSALVRRYLIKYLGSEINGLNSLYISIVGFLSVAELGIGSAIIFCMYKPIVDGDQKKVIALYKLIEKLYRIIGVVVLGLGLCVVPFLPTLAKGYSISHTEMYISYTIMLISSVLTYAYGAKSALLEAYKNNYISTTIVSSGTLLKYGLQIAAAICLKSFYAFLACIIISDIFQWVLLEIYTRKKHGEIITGKEKVDKETGRYVVKNVKAMFMHKTGIILVNTADSVIISAFIGVVALGGYSNYVTIMTSMVQVLLLFFTPLISVIGHLFANDENGETVKYFNFFHIFNFMLGVLFFLGYYGIITDLVVLLFGEGLELTKILVFIITYNYFIQFMRNAVIMFRDATGTFYYDRWKSLVEGLVNIVLSILFVLIFPDEYKIVGVLIATIITDLFICHVVEPYVLFKHGLHKRLSAYYVKNYVLIAIFGGLLWGYDKLLVQMENRFLELLVNGCIAVGVAVIVFAICLAADKDFRKYTGKLLHRKKVGN